MNGGSGYTMPTVAFDLPDDPDGVQATGHAEMDLNGTITAVHVDDGGSGYATAPDVAVLNGTQFEPLPLNDDGSYATFAPPAPDGTIMASGLTLTDVVMDTFGSGYINPPVVTITDPVQGGGGGSGLFP